MKNQSIVQRLTIAALLGTLPTMLEGQGPHAANTAPQSPADDTVDELAPDAIRVAARPIARGSVLTAADIAYEKKTNAAGNASPHSIAINERDRRPAAADDSLIGFTARRLIATGEPLRAPAVIPPRLVASGDMVDVIWRDGSIVVTAKGRATRAAGAGERIAVRIDEKRTVEGMVVAAGRVRVD
jgi:flagella basal body P-ring formation protein FlgA